MKYEICYLVGESNEAKLAEIKAGAEKIIAEEGGIFQEIETQDRRKLAYKVEKDIRGIYVTRRFELPEKDGENDPSTALTSSSQAGSGQEKNPIGEINKKLNLFGDVLRFLIIKADKLPELKQREIPVKVEKRERKFDRPRVAQVSPARREFSAKTESKPAEKRVESDPAAEAKKEKAIDQKLDELLNI